MKKNGMELGVWLRVVFCVLLAGIGRAQEEGIEAPVRLGGQIGLDPSLRREAQAALDRGVTWLLARQDARGFWSNPEFPALTALPLWALAAAEVDRPAAIEAAIGYLLDCVHPNGAIYREPTEDRRGGGLPTYNTALSMTALAAVNRPELTPVILKARAYVADSQALEGTDLYEGGFGYDAQTGRAYADLSNTVIALEALRLTEHLEDQRTEGERADPDWEAAQRFLARVQHLPETNPAGWVDDSPAQRGGFIYRPDQSQAGTIEREDGTVTFRAYGSMTYAGLLSLIFAGVDRDDPRVRSAFDWSVRHWCLAENPGMGTSGLFYFYNVLSKALAAYGRTQFTTDAGAEVNWRAELARTLIAQQQIEPDTGAGYWVNADGRWWEADPVLVTAYSLLALDMALTAP
ncbi:MAG: hypothetical protein K9N49_03605 [Candidatus Marinimicrobia bacterium]|nr:hypothetical protein [Candidatus Neomarinimicrobiota bacterium]